MILKLHLDSSGRILNSYSAHAFSRSSSCQNFSQSFYCSNLVYFSSFQIHRSNVSSSSLASLQSSCPPLMSRHSCWFFIGRGALLESFAGVHLFPEMELPGLSDTQRFPNLLTKFLVMASLCILFSSRHLHSHISHSQYSSFHSIVGIIQIQLQLGCMIFHSSKLSLRLFNLPQTSWSS